MNNKTIIGVAIAVLILGGIIWIARPDSSKSSNQEQPDIASSSNGIIDIEDTANYDFGSISMAAGKVKHDFKVKNTGREQIVINKVYTSCMCTIAELKIGDKSFGPFGMPGHGVVPTINGVINSGEEATVEAIFDPAAHGPAGVGKIQRTIKLENTAGEPIELWFSATVTP